MLALKEKCIHPTNQKPYIGSAMGGKDNCPEPFKNGFTHAFVMQFESAEDRDYYVAKDPAHQAFIGGLQAIVEKAHVMDFTDGEF
ncbi:hypothetical protein ACJ72_00371 [Emergomyces africanus]|uniref:Stress-response A/B barrel domain-containing protein n=1 Tax=Emergomyces africanus TaxID=1955775 RepID=A0A1B7P8D8_9EURO|nr:hypothetical protein ACJ72_00371 [Emergomyces africanus]